MRAFKPEEWARVRSRGKPAFLVRYGVLQRGVPLGVLIAVVIEATLGSPLPDALTSGPFLLRAVLFSAVFSASGCLAAHANWNLHERRYAGRA
jgi:hypothetical protein